MRCVQAIAGILSLLGAGYLLVTGSLCSQPSSGSQEQSLVLSPAAHDFGEVDPNGGDLTARFELSNTFGEPVEVAEIMKGCSCADAAVEPKTVPAGGTGVLTVIWRVAGKQGLTSENIVLVCKVGTRTEHIPAKVRTRVATPVEADRDVVELDTSNRRSTRVGFRARDERPFRLTGAATNHPSLTATIEPDGRSVSITLDPAQSGWESGRLSAVITTDRPGMESITIRVHVAK